MKLQLKGFLVNLPASMSVSINGEQVFVGSFDENYSTEEITYFEQDYNAQLNPKKTVSVAVSVLSGTVGLGSALIWVDDFMPKVPSFYTPRDNRRHTPTYDIDHRANILINGISPKWPSTLVDPMPKGNPDNPDWNGWVFTLAESDTMTFDVVFPYWPRTGQRLPFCQGDIENNNLQWYDADGNKIASDPLGEDFWIARQNGVD